MRPLNDLIRELTTWGTPACGLLCGVLGAIAALLWIALGFWRMFPMRYPTVLNLTFRTIGSFTSGARRERSGFL